MYVYMCMCMCMYMCMYIYIFNIKVQYVGHPKNFMYIYFFTAYFKANAI